MEKKHIEIDDALTSHVAHLARIELTEAERTTFTEQVGRVLGYAEQLQEVDVEGMAPMVHPFDQKTLLREDFAIDSPRNQEGVSKVLGCATEVLHHGFKVPPILGG